MCRIMCTKRMKYILLPSTISNYFLIDSITIPSSQSSQSHHRLDHHQPSSLLSFQTPVEVPLLDLVWTLKLQGCEQPGAQDLLAKWGGFGLSNWRDSEVRRRGPAGRRKREPNSGGSSTIFNISCRFFTVNLKVEEIFSTPNFHFHHFHFL